MTSTVEFLEYVCGQFERAGEVTYRKMFGSYGIYLDKKFIGLICYDQFYLKPTDIGRSILETPYEEPPFPGAKDWFILEDLDDREFLAHLLIATWEEIPFPKLKKSKNNKICL